MIKVISWIVVVLFSFQTGFAQAPKKVNQSVQWSSINSTIKIHKNLGVYVEGNFRFVRDLQPQQHQFRTALEITLAKNLLFAPLGYVYTWNYLYGKQPASFINNEHRVYQQVVYKQHWSKFKFQHRLRVEERFLQSKHIGTEGTVTGFEYDDVRYRLRYRALATMPFLREKIEAKTLFLSVWDELFVSWGKKVTYHEPDQNRIFVGLGYQVTKDFSVQAGGIYQMLKKSNGALQENNYGAMVQVTYNVDLTD